MTRSPAITRQMYLDVESTSPGCMGSMLNMFDWNAALPGGKKLLTDPDYTDGLEAPRNSFETVSGVRAIGAPKNASTTTPFEFKPSQSVTTRKDYSSDNEKKRRTPSVVARLMGLDALPDAVCATISERQQIPQKKKHKEKLSVAQKLLKGVQVRYTNEQARTLELRPVEELNTTNNPQHAGISQNHEDQFECAPAREEHPQEKQLQEFKKKFGSKFSVQSHGSRSQSQSLSREMEVKRAMSPENMDETDPVLSAELDDPERLASALEKLSKSPEFQEVLEVFKSNKEFFLKFLQDPKAMLFDRHFRVPTTEGNIDMPPPPVEVKAKEESVSKEKSSEKKKKGGLSPGAFARRFMESRREEKESMDNLKCQQVSTFRLEIQENVSISTPKMSLLPRFRGRSKSKSAETDKELMAHEPRLSVDSEGKVEPSSPGNIVLLRPGSTDSTGISSPASVLSCSPRMSRAGVRDRTSRMEKNRHDDWECAAPSDDTSRQAKESTRHREKTKKSEREKSKESRNIARDIIQEARASVRDCGECEPSAPGEVTICRSGRSGRRITLSRMAPDRADITCSSDGEMTPCSTEGPSRASGDDQIRPLGIRGHSSLSSAVTMHLSSRSPIDLVNNRMIFVEQRNRRGGDKQQTLLLEEQKRLVAARKSALDRTDSLPGSAPPRTISSSSKLLRNIIAGNRVLTSDSWHLSHYNKMTLPQLLMEGDRMSSASQSEEDNVANSPGTLSSASSLQRCRSVPNAAVVRDSRSRGDQPQNSAGGRAGSNPPHSLLEPSAPDSVVVSGGKHFSESYKRRVEAVGSLFARAKSKQRNKIFVRSRKKLQVSEDELTGPSFPTSPESITVSCSSIVSSVTSLEDVARCQFDASDASPRGSSVALATSGNTTETSETSIVKKISFASDLKLSFQQEEPRPLSRTCCDPHSPSALALMTCEQGVRLNAELATDQCSGLTDSITDILEVSAGEQLARGPNIHSVATEPPRHEEEDVQEKNVDKGGQPSPISVLDSPFEEDSRSPLEFNEISSDLQELRLRLRLLRLDGRDRPRSLVDSAQYSKDIQTSQDLFGRDSHVGESTDYQISRTLDSPKSPTPKGIAGAVFSPKSPEICRDERALLESIDLEGFPYPAGRRDDLVYVRDLLVASEFVGSVTNIFTRWHSFNQPLDPILFVNLEEYYNRRSYENQYITSNGHIEGPGVAGATLNHRVLFDAVNEVLSRKLGPYITFCPWVQSSICRPRPICVGRMLVWEIWMELCGFFPSDGVDASSFLLNKDLSRGAEWMGVCQNVEELGLELEKAILNDLIDETVCSLTHMGR